MRLEVVSGSKRKDAAAVRYFLTVKANGEKYEVEVNRKRWNRASIGSKVEITKTELNSARKV